MIAQRLSARLIDAGTLSEPAQYSNRRDGISPSLAHLLIRSAHRYLPVPTKGEDFKNGGGGLKPRHLVTVHRASHRRSNGLTAGAVLSHFSYS